MHSSSTHHQFHEMHQQENEKLLLCGKVKKVLSCAHVYSLEQRARNPHDQNEQTLTEDFVVMTNKLNFEFLEQIAFGMK